MVRTYACNPSTQSFGVSDQLMQPFVVVGSQTPKSFMSKFESTQYERDIYPSKCETAESPAAEEDYHDFDLPYSPDFHQHRQHQPNDFCRAISEESVEDSSFQSPPISTYQMPKIRNSKSFGSVLDKMLNIEEEQTTILGIRSVLINGQRFYQPLNMTSDDSVAADHSAFLHKQQQLDAETRCKRVSIPMLVKFMDNNNQKAGKEFAQTRPKQPKLLSLAKPCAAEQRKRVVRSSSPPPRLNFAKNAGPPTTTKGFEATRSSSTFLHKPTFDHEAEDDALPPWARGNPQPKSGKRGTNNWLSGQASLPSLDESSASRCMTNTNDKFEINLNSTSSTYTLPFSASKTFKDSAQFAELAEKERHKHELLRQIEENKHRKFIEKQREFELEERERIRDEMYQQRVKMELEEERKREQEKKLLLEKKAAHLEQVRNATMRAMQGEAAETKSKFNKTTTKTTGARKSSKNDAREKDVNADGDDDVEEWWEKKDRLRALAATAERGASPVIPALRNKAVRENVVAESEDSNFEAQSAAPRSRSLDAKKRGKGGKGSIASSSSSFSSESSTKENQRERSKFRDRGATFGSKMSRNRMNNNRSPPLSVDVDIDE